MIHVAVSGPPEGLDTTVRAVPTQYPPNHVTGDPHSRLLQTQPPHNPHAAVMDWIIGLRVASRDTSVM
ncbi:hypothetical protein N7535_005261 [Penicillium sp. DV-2018c]|nr:hypothetical protein N7461_008840 [Penicillium sp. DV-2018c]KAJ5571601.1 hypothetical protein N7535_005261 [Penicillium sp. DV-2018c]